MTENEIVMLTVGATLGAHLMNVLHAYWASQDAQRNAAAAQAAAKRAAGDRFMTSFRLYQLQARREAQR